MGKLELLSRVEEQRRAAARAALLEEVEVPAEMVCPISSDISEPSHISGAVRGTERVLPNPRECGEGERDEMICPISSDISDPSRIPSAVLHAVVRVDVVVRGGREMRERDGPPHQLRHQ
eukprot:3595211-Rhodomonas_salina.1